MFNNQATNPGLPLASSLAEFGAIYRRERQALGLTQSDVAQKVGCRRQTIADMEAGRSVTTLTLFNALGAIGKQLQVCALGLDLENVRDLLGPDWAQ
ncbi:MAG: helix-turn-helix transcriptional regulator [Pseudomonadota bacterium]